MSAVSTRSLRIFIAHPSGLMTDHISNGDGLVAFGLIRRLAERGHEVHVAAQHVKLRDAIPPTLHIHQLVGRGDGSSAASRVVFMARMRLLFERLRRQRPFDIAHQMNPVYTGLSLALLGASTPLVLGSYIPKWDTAADDPLGRRRAPPFRARLGARIARYQQAQASGLLIASPSALSRIEDTDRHRDRIFEVPHGIDLVRFAERTVMPAKPSILFLAGVSRKKGIFTLLDAFERVHRAVPGCELVIAGGDGGAIPEVRARAAAMTGASIRVLGEIARADVHDLVRSHSVFCVPSYGEPFGMSSLEAMACGVPVVATRAGGIADLVSEQGGRLVPPRDAAALATALIEVLTSHDLQRSMGRHNRERAETIFDLERTAARLERAYRTILEERQGSGRAPRTQPGPVAGYRGEDAVVF